MNHIYTTRAIILKSMPIGEANRSYVFLTKDLGLIRATAQGVRLAKSKLKGHLQDFCLVNVSLVKGKEWWRITSVESISPCIFMGDSRKLIIAKNIFSLLLRLVVGEEHNEPLFLGVDSFYNFLSTTNGSEDTYKDLEIVTVLRILYSLGHLKESPELSVFMFGSDISIASIAMTESVRKIAIAHINTSLKESSL